MSVGVPRGVARGWCYLMQDEEQQQHDDVDVQAASRLSDALRGPAHRALTAFERARKARGGDGLLDVAQLCPSCASHGTDGLLRTRDTAVDPSKLALDERARLLQPRVGGRVDAGLARCGWHAGARGRGRGGASGSFFGHPLFHAGGEELGLLLIPTRRFRRDSGAARAAQPIHGSAHGTQHTGPLPYTGPFASNCRAIW